jgi:hypothetical protein
MTSLLMDCGKDREYSLLIMLESSLIHTWWRLMFANHTFWDVAVILRSILNTVEGTRKGVPQPRCSEPVKHNDSGASRGFPILSRFCQLRVVWHFQLWIVYRVLHNIWNTPMESSSCWPSSEWLASSCMWRRQTPRPNVMVVLWSADYE